jgi:5-methylcytosine-specific restriction endonuclease McrA
MQFVNARISKKERNLLKGAMRRVFSRSDLRKAALEASIIQHSDPARPRVTKWSRCSLCSKPEPTYLMEIDHVVPIIPVDSSLDEMTLDEVANRIWCEVVNLMPVCKPCHKIKTSKETKARAAHKKTKKALNKPLR